MPINYLFLWLLTDACPIVAAVVLASAAVVVLVCCCCCCCRCICHKSIKCCACLPKRLKLCFFTIVSRLSSHFFCLFCSVLWSLYADFCCRFDFMLLLDLLSLGFCFAARSKISINVFFRSPFLCVCVSVCVLFNYALFEWLSYSIEATAVASTNSDSVCAARKS